MAEIFIITGTKIVEREQGIVRWSFMFESGAPFPNFASISNTFGVLFHTDVWKIHIFDAQKGGEIFSAWCDSQEDLPELFAKAIQNVPDFVVLMPRNVYDVIAPVTQIDGLTVNVHHYDGTLYTS